MASPSPTITEDSSPVGNSKVNSAYCSTGVTPAICTQELAGHETNLPRHPYVRVPIIGSCPNGPSTVRAVTVVVHRISVKIHGIHPVHIVDVTIVIIINPISRYLIGIIPHLTNQFLVGVSDSSVDHRHDQILGTGCGIPCFYCTNINPFSAAILTRVLQAPQPPLRQPLVTGHNGTTDQKIRLNRFQHAGGLKRLHP